MEARGLLLCLLVPLVGYHGVFVYGQVATLCRPNERFLACGSCQKTCRDPAPACAGVCRTGCYCPEDEVRNDTGECVKLSECPPLASSELKTSEPRSTDFNCPENEEYRSCEPCNKTCDNPNPICPAQCARGCFCVDNLVRDADGTCVKPEECSKVFRESDNANLVKPYQLTCGLHQEYHSCQRCERTCNSPEPVCSVTKACIAGCFCLEGWAKAPSGQCVKPEDCPRAPTDLHHAEESMSGNHEVSIEDCSPDEVYLACGWCEPSCSDPAPECPKGVCTRGCLCRPPLLRHHSGQCVEPHTCAPQKCSEQNEEYVCRYGCEARCDLRTCSSRPRRCQLGCHCKLGLFRDTDGKCVPLNKCSNTTYLYDDLFANTSQTRPGNPGVRSSIFMPPVFDPIKLATTKFNSNGSDIRRIVNYPRPYNFFKTFVFNTTPSKLLGTDMNADKASSGLKNSKDEVLSKFGNPNNNVFFKQTIFDPFKDLRDRKSSEIEEPAIFVPMKTVTFEFTNKDITLDPNIKDETFDPQLPSNFNKGANLNGDKRFFQHVFTDHGNGKETEDFNVFSDLMKIIKQMLPPNFTLRNYTSIPVTNPHVTMM